MREGRMATQCFRGARPASQMRRGGSDATLQLACAAPRNQDGGVVGVEAALADAEPQHGVAVLRKCRREGFSADESAWE